MTIRKLKEETFNFFVNGEGDKTSLNTNRPKLRYFDEGLDYLIILLFDIQEVLFEGLFS